MLHEVLWMRRSPAKGTVRVHQSELADELHVSRHTMSRIMGRMVDEGRLVRIGNDYHEPMFRVVDPADWAPANA